VVVDLLSSEADARRERRRRGRLLTQLGEQAGPHRIERDHRRRRILDDVHLAHVVQLRA